MEIAQSLQQIPSSYIREILAAASSDSVISLAGGLPDQSTFPIKLMESTLARLTSMPEVFQYGSTEGYGPLLAHLNELYQLPDNHKAMVCTGSQQGLDLIARAYMDPGDKIVMEAPSYLGAMQVFGLSQANMLSVSQNDEGPDTIALEQIFKENKIKLFYAVPDFHNPTGVCWSLATRQKVAALCQRYDVALVEDAPYRELRFTGNELPMVSSFCPDHSIVLRSFSKIASPGLRIGVVTGKESYIQPLVKVKQGADLHSSIPMQALLLGLLQHPEFDQHLVGIRNLYQARYQKMMGELTKQLPNNCLLKSVEGGMFIWLSLPDCDTFQLANDLLAQGVAVVPSDVFYANRSEVKSALRLNFTNSSLEEIEQAVAVIAKQLSSL
ncbi:MAG: PLP-dependent aminotransferase family protein [Aliivibrio sp.]|uniref:aminotransferase-like domain-containing protein n=1 Tax=Aliivibrio sp. TaxID=1872443 RepID=UPI001A3F03DF|nr:PLP-dependent aminotransferase family protein [Aliivibrio sp.]